MSDIKDVRITKTIDCKKMLCPMPVYRAAEAIKKPAPGEVLEVLCTDPGSLADFPAFARQTGHELTLPQTLTANP